MSKYVPALLDKSEYDAFPAIEETEKEFFIQARQLYDAGFPDHALLDIWNASIHNLRRRLETYGVDLFLSTIKDEPGRKKYDYDGETIN